MITFCIPSKNNLRYLKPCIKSIQDNSYYKTNEILVYVDQDKDGTCEWLDEQGVRYIKNDDWHPKGIGYAYDTMFKEAKHDYVIAFHADMILGIDADYYMMSIKNDNNIICATRIEPPLHPPGIEKIVMDFGMWPEDLKLEEFNRFVVAEKSGKTTNSIFAPWLIHRDQHLGHDPIFKSVFEDADLFRRFKLYGFELIQSWDAMVYHLTCRGGQFSHAETMEDFKKKDEAWSINNAISMNNYIRKWGGFLKQTDTLEPIPNVKYNIGLDLVNDFGNNNNFSSIEPFFDNIKCKVNTDSYCKHVQQLTSYDIKSKFVDELTNDIILVADYNDILANPQNFQYLLHNLPQIIEHDVDGPGEYQLDPYKLIVKQKRESRPKLKLC